MEILNNIHLSNSTLNVVNSLMGGLSKSDLGSILKWDLVQQAVNGPLFPWIFGIHALFTCCKLRPQLKYQHWFFNLIICWIATFSGTTMASYLVCKPPAWLSSNQQVPLLILIWYFVNFSPFDIVFKLFNFLPIKLLIILVENVNRSRSIFIGVELALANVPGSGVAAILLGSIAGFGGALVTNFLLKVTHSPDFPSEFSKPTWASKSAFFVCLFYYLSKVDFNSLSWTLDKPILLHSDTMFVDLVKMLIIFYLVLHAITAELIGPFTPPPINILEGLFFFLTRIGNTEPEVTALDAPPAFYTKSKPSSSIKDEAPKNVTVAEVSKKNPNPPKSEGNNGQKKKKDKQN